MERGFGHGNVSVDLAIEEQDFRGTFLIPAVHTAGTREPCSLLSVPVEKGFSCLVPASALTSVQSCLFVLTL